MAKSLLTSICLLLFKLISGQNPPYINNYAQPAPNAASLGKYLDYPVSFHTGVPEISIPIYQLKDGAASVNVSLSYHASGIRVSEVASWVGLGWTLNAGGAITRTVRGGPDEGTRNAGGTGMLSGYYKSNGLSNMPDDVGDQPGTAANTNGFWAKVQDIITGAGDGESDLYFFSCNGISGKFVFDEMRNPRLLTEGDHKIQVTFDGTNFTGWIITTADGVEYHFGQGNTIEKTKSRSILSGYSNNSNVPSSWLITQIVYPNDKDIISFNYISESSYGYYDLGPENLTSHDYRTRCFETTDRDLILTIVEGKRLQSIESDNFKIEFIANGVREDLVAPINETTISNAGVNSIAKRLDIIKVYCNDLPIRQFELQYGYFTSSTLTLMISSHQTITGTTDSKRLKLNSITEKSGDAQILKPATQFVYEESISLPRRLNYDQDHWGYSNNTTSNPVNNKFMPGFLNDCTNAGAIRSSNNVAMKGFVLTKIIQPTGVASFFEFEAHNTGTASSPNYIGGLRIKKITHKDNLTSNIQVRKYSYTAENGVSTGILYNDPVYFRKIYNEYIIWGTTSTAGFIGYNTIASLGFIKSSSSIVPMQSFNGNHIGYSAVREILAENSEGGYTDYHFVSISSNHKSTRLHQNNFVQSNNPNGQFQNVQPHNLTYYTSYNASLFYPDAPEQVDLLRGSLTKKMVYNAGGELLKVSENNYQEKINETYWTRNLKVGTLLQKFYEGRPDEFSILQRLLTYYKLRTGFSFIKTTTETALKDGKKFVTVTTTDHESPNHTQPTTIESVSSTGEAIKKQIIYSFDYSDGTAPNDFYGKLKSKNILVPLEERIWKGGNLVSGTATEFKDFDANADIMIKPFRIYAVETNTALTPVQIGFNQALSYPYSVIPATNSYYKLKVEYVYDPANATITEQKLANNDKIESIIWDNNASQPLAQVSNASIAEVAFCSFENTSKGYWTYSGNPVTDASAPTGTYAYNLSNGNIAKPAGLTTSKSYIISWWAKAGSTVTVTGGNLSNARNGTDYNGWTYYEKEVNGASGVTISGTGNIDELKIYPKDALMVCFTYNLLHQLQSVCNANGSISYYEYDGLQRLVVIKDQNKHIIKAMEYNYQNLPPAN